MPYLFAIGSFFLSSILSEKIEVEIFVRKLSHVHKKVIFGKAECDLYKNHKLLKTRPITLSIGKNDFFVERIGAEKIIFLSSLSVFPKDLFNKVSAHTLAQFQIQ